MAGSHRSHVRARLVGPRLGLFGSVCRQQRSRTWPVYFPGGRRVRAEIRAISQAQVARVQGQLALGTAWLPGPLPLLPLGIYLPGLRMRLPEPTPDA